MKLQILNNLRYLLKITPYYLNYLNKHITIIKYKLLLKKLAGLGWLVGWNTKFI